MNLPLLQQHAEKHNAASYAYLRWLMILATGAFSLMVGIVLDPPSQGETALKVALTANAMSILFGAIAVYGEVKLIAGTLNLLCDREVHTHTGNHEAAASVPLVYTLPAWIPASRICFYGASFTSITFWVVFIWTR